MARGAPRRGALALGGARRRRRRHRQDAPRARVPRRARRRRATSSCRPGPTPRWAEVGYWALRSARSCSSPRCPQTGGASREWVGRHARGAPRPRPTSSVTSRPIAPPRSRPTSAASPRPRRCAGRSSARASARAAIASSSRSTTSTASTARAATRSPTRSAIRRSSRRCSSPRTRPGSIPGGPPTSRRRACSPGCPPPRSRRSLAQAGRPSAPAFDGVARRSLPLYLEQLLRYRPRGVGRRARRRWPTSSRCASSACRPTRGASCRPCAVWGDDADDEVLDAHARRRGRPRRGARASCGAPG